MIESLLSKFVGTVMSVLIMAWFAINVLGVGIDATGEMKMTKNIGVSQSASNSASCMSKITSGNFNNTCKSVTIGGTKIGG